MKPTALPLALAASALLAFGIGTTAIAQQPGPPPPGPGGHGHFVPPPPKNLQVLPKNLTGEQVHEIMHKWEAALGTECSTCHAADPKNIGPNGRPRLDFPSDAKPEKATARLMVKMVHDINSNYVSMVDNSGAPVTCGTCHRGHLTPEPFVAPPEEHHERPAPPAGQTPPHPQH